MSNVVPFKGSGKIGAERLLGDGGPPHDGGMEDRVAKLEDRMERVENRLSKIEDKMDRLLLDVAEMKGRLTQMPTTLHLIGFAVAVFVAAGVLRWISA